MDSVSLFWMAIEMVKNQANNNLQAQYYTLVQPLKELAETTTLEPNMANACEESREEKSWDQMTLQVKASDIEHV